MSISKRIEEIDLAAEKRLLSFDEWEERICLEKEIEEISFWEDLQWKQRAGKNWFLQGDANTRFFHQFMNGRRRKSKIAVLDSEDGEIRGQKNITDHIVGFYKQLFGHNSPCSLKLGENFWPQNLKVSEKECNELIKAFALEEIRGVIMDMKENLAPGPNGFGVVFFKKFWECIKGEMGAMFEDFWRG